MVEISALLISVSGVLFAGLALVQLYWGSKFVRMVKKVPQDDPAAPLPKALICLCLRGADPFLDRTLRALLKQSHTDFHLRLMIDSETDPVWSVVNPFLREVKDPRIQVRLLTKRLPSCSLKNSALLQATEVLDNDYEILVQVDADAVPYRDWLKDLLRPFADPKVGAVSGLRWYAPKEHHLSNVMRFYWGCSAMIQMREFGMIWGGSMAFRRELLETTSLRDLWATSLVDDLILSKAIKQANMTVKHVPAVLVNEESTDLNGCFQFIRRQSFMVRHSHPSWPKVSAYAILGSVATMSNLTGFVMALMVPDLELFAGGVCLAVLYAAIYHQFSCWGDNAIRRRVALQGESMPARHRLPFMVLPATMFMYTACWLSSALIRSISWRGVTYQVSSGGAVRKQGDAPFAANATVLTEASVT